MFLVSDANGEVMVLPAIETSSDSVVPSMLVVLDEEVCFELFKLDVLFPWLPSLTPKALALSSLLNCNRRFSIAGLGLDQSGMASLSFFVHCSRSAAFWRSMEFNGLDLNRSDERDVVESSDGKADC